jgi:hypothetical protein
MIRHVIALAILAGPALPAFAQAPDTEDNRYQLNQVDDGYLRLDLKSGQVSLCSRRPAGWACQAVPDDRAAYEGEIARLQGENAALKKALLDRGLALPGAIKPGAPTAQGDSEPKPPGNADADRVLGKLEKAWRRLVDMVTSFQKELADRM